MRFSFSQLGPVFQADMELGKLTVICGNNNTGKTYVTHTVFSMADRLSRATGSIEFNTPEKVLDELLAGKVAQVDLNEYIVQIPGLLKKFSSDFSNNLYEVFGAGPENFKDASVEINADVESINFASDYLVEWPINWMRNANLKIDFKSESGKLILSDFDLAEDIPTDYRRDLLQSFISAALSKALIVPWLGKPFISSAERTGAAIFQRELDFSRWRMLDAMADRSKEINPIDFLRSNKTDYPYAVEFNVDFIRDLPNVAKRESNFINDYPAVGELLNKILSGDYSVGREGISFKPHKHPGSSNRTKALGLSAVSSTVRSLLDLNYYLRSVVSTDSFLIIDEPEMNLHPENQILMAKLIVELVNAGVRVMITTHSDYILRELGMAVMMSNLSERLLDEDELEILQSTPSLNPDFLKVYEARVDAIRTQETKRKVQRMTLKPVEVNADIGVDSAVFDHTIQEQNDRYNLLRWS